MIRKRISTRKVALGGTMFLIFLGLLVMISPSDTYKNTQSFLQELLFTRKAAAEHKGPQHWRAEHVVEPASKARVQRMHASKSRTPAVQASTFLTYVFAESDPESTNNLGFFLQRAVRANDLVDYLIVLQDGASGIAAAHIEKLARRHEAVPNLHFVRHPNKCFDVGTFGELFKIFEQGGSVPAAYSDKEVKFDVAQFEFFAVINSGIRGPFLPLSHGADLHWLQPFINMIDTNGIKLVGPTIGCGPSPHVQSYMWVFDKSTLALFKSHPSVFACYKTQKEQVDNVELGASRLLLEKGFNIGCLMLRYNGVDFRRPENNNCNRGTNPLPMRFHNGVSLDALEVMFIKYKRRFLKDKWDHVLRAQRYTEYATDLAATAHNSERVIANQFHDDPAIKQQLFDDVMATHTQNDFDAAHYKKHNYDLAQLTDQQLWEHFVEWGYAEARPHSWKVF
jgi:hypothetical protein